MLETLREYALAKLDLHHERQAQHLRHADFFVELSENAERGMLAHQQQSFARLLREHDNIRAALRWLIDKGDSNARYFTCHGSLAASVAWRPNPVRTMSSGRVRGD
jgi:predicted ATPase